MSRHNAAISEPRERELPAATTMSGRSTIPAGFALYVGDIAESLLAASGASDLMLNAKLMNDLPAMARHVAVIEAEAKSAAVLAARLGKHISRHRRLSNGGRQ